MTTAINEEAPSYRYSEGQLVPYKVCYPDTEAGEAVIEGARYDTMEDVKTVIKGFCQERNIPFYSEHSEKKRFEVRCPHTK